jgi:hypothetical protein
MSNLDEAELQAGRLRVRFPMVSLEFFNGNTVPVTLFSLFDTASNRNDYQEFFCEVRAADAYG